MSWHNWKLLERSVKFVRGRIVLDSCPQYLRRYWDSRILFSYLQKRSKTHLQGILYLKFTLLKKRSTFRFQVRWGEFSEWCCKTYGVLPRSGYAPLQAYHCEASAAKQGWEIGLVCIHWPCPVMTPVAIRAWRDLSPGCNVSRVLLRCALSESSICAWRRSLIQMLILHSMGK